MSADNLDPPANAPGSGVRLALCGNVFPGDTPGAVLSALEGPIRSWSEVVRDSGYDGPLGFGLYLSDAAASKVSLDEERRGRLARALCRADVELWTANAFPFGNFHGSRVKERAFLPDWRNKERLVFSCHVAKVMGQLMMPDTRGSLSTCPLGYGPDARRSRKSVEHLRRFQEELLQREEKTGVRLVLAIEPEPDGAFERVSDLAPWLAEHVVGDYAIDDRRIGVCWDLCHSAVVGESPEEAIASVRDCGIPIGKVQISAALRIEGAVRAASFERLRELAEDPYLHQVRGQLADGRPFASSDLARLLQQPDQDVLHDLRIHCHVPVHREQFGDGLSGTAWRRAVDLAMAAGIRDFEVETYTLPVLPEAYLERAGMVGTLASETLACLQSLGLYENARDLVG